MRIAVVRVHVDPAGSLAPDQLAHGMATLRALAGPEDIEVLDTNLAEMPVARREVQMLMAGSDADEVRRIAVGLCTRAFGAFGAVPTPGVVTYVSRGTDADAHGVLDGFGITGVITRRPGEDGLDIVHVTLRKADLARIPESRIHTALEACLNCEVHIATT